MKNNFIYKFISKDNKKVDRVEINSFGFSLFMILQKLFKEEDTLEKYAEEILNFSRKRDKLELALGGIKNMGGIPDVIVIFDTNKEKIALQEAKMLNIPIVAIVDSNSNPDDINYPIPGNDDATRSINTFCELISDSIISGINNYSSNLGGSDSTESLSENSDKLDAIEKKLEDNDNKSNKSNTPKEVSDKKGVDTGELDL